MQQTPLSSFFKLPTQLQATTIQMSWQPSTSRQDLPPAKRLQLTKGSNFQQQSIFLNICLFGCAASQLWYMGSSTFIGHTGSLVATCGIQFLDQRSNPVFEGANWECRVLATRPQGKSQQWQTFKVLCVFLPTCIPAVFLSRGHHPSEFVFTTLQLSSLILPHR